MNDDEEFYEKYPMCRDCPDDGDMCGELEDCPQLDSSGIS